MPPLSSPSRGRWCVFAAALLWSTNGLFVKNVIFESWPHERRGLLLAFWRALFAAAFLLPLVRRPRFSWRLVPMAAAFVAMNFVFLQSMVWTTAGNAIWLQNIAPLWVCLFARLSGHTLDPRDRNMLGFALAGVGLILFCELGRGDWNGTAVQGVLLGFVSGLFYAGVIHSLRMLRDFDSAWLIVFSLGATAAALLPVPIATGIWPAGLQWPVLIAFGVFQLGAAYVLFARGLRTISGQEGSGIALLEPVLVPVWVWLSYGDKTNWWTIAGGTLIFCGLAWRYLGPKNDPGTHSA